MFNVRKFNAADATGVNQNIRVVEDSQGNPWFSVKDVCWVLGYSIKSNGSVNVNGATRNLHESELMDYRFKGERGRPAKLVSESGFYKLVLRSQNEVARPFQDWVTQVVLPAIRKDGAYIKGEEKVATGEVSEDEFILKAMTMLQGKVERLKSENEALTKRVNTLTIGQFAYDEGVYFSHGQKIRLAATLRRLMNEAGEEREEALMDIHKSDGSVVKSKVYKYPRWALESAVRSLKTAIQ